MPQDLRLAFRLLGRSPGFAATVVLTLALGIGASTAVFSVVDGVLLRPAPVREIQRLVVIWETDRHSGTTREPASVPDYLDFQSTARGFATIAAFMASETNLVLRDGDPVRLPTLAVSQPFLPMLGVVPIRGRLFTPAEDRAGGPRVALISESLWNRLFAGAPSAVGRTLELDDTAHTVVGIVPDAADFGIDQVLRASAYSRGYVDRSDRLRVDVWLPLQPDPATLPRETHPIIVLGRLARGTSLGTAQSELSGVAADLERTYPVNDGRGVFLEPLHSVVFGPTRPTLLVLLGAVGILLMVACVNVANLLLARGAGRRAEVAIRTALGAGELRLGRQFLVESVVLSGLAALSGLAIASVGVRGLVALAPPDVPRLDAVSIDWRVLAATTVVGIGVALVFGLVPTMQARRVDVVSALKHETFRARRSARGGARAGLVVAELALAVVLAAGAGLLVRSFWGLQGVDPGFRAAGVLKAEYQLPPSRYPVDFDRWPDFHEMHAFTDALLRRAAALPGVESVGIAGNHPLDPGFTNSFTIAGREAEGRDWPEISVRRVTPGYFATVGLAVVRGRAFDASDRTRAAPVAIINEAAARRFFDSRDPLGARIAFWGTKRAIVGIAANEKFHGLAESVGPAVYAPLAQAPSANGSGVLLVRAAGDPLALGPGVRRTIHEIDPQLAVFGVEALETTVDRSLSRRRFAMLLLGVFASTALLLAAVGVHGVLSHAVSTRTREIGIRMALGARPAGVLRLVIAQGIAMAGLGIGIGLLATLVASRLVSSLLFGVTPRDPLTLAAVAILLGTVACVASLVSARRATRIDPAVAFRGE